MLLKIFNYVKISMLFVMILGLEICFYFINVLYLGEASIEHEMFSYRCVASIFVSMSVSFFPLICLRYSVFNGLMLLKKFNVR